VTESTKDLLIEGMSDELRSSLDRFDPRFDDPSELGKLLLQWLDGRAAAGLLGVLDLLRARRAYPLSLIVLEAAWNSDLSPDRLGRVAEDWIGTVLYGLGDNAGGREVAEHICKTAEGYGPAFNSDLGHLLLQWELPDLAGPLIIKAAAKLPGDMSAQFNLGVIKKLAGDWAESAEAFKSVLQFRSDDSASLWNLGVAQTALGQLDGARKTWQSLGIDVPDGDDDYAVEGELIPVRIRTPNAAPEVLWARRLCPARARLKGIPLRYDQGCYNDEVLIDGVTDGEAVMDGKPAPIYNVLEFSRSGKLTPYGLRLTTEETDLETLVNRLNQEVIPHADWRRLVHLADFPIVIALPAGPVGAQVLASLEDYGDWIDLYEHLER
jgi:tetratricopeptide (TPR) repeat protein